MGKLIYGDSDMGIDIDDRSLAHLQVVIGNKLRRGESFFFSWKDDPGVGDGRSAIWLDRAIPLYFKFSGGRAPELNRDWILDLTVSANSGTGMVFTDEPHARSGPTKALRGHI